MIGMEDVIERYSIKKALQKTKRDVSKISVDISDFSYSNEDSKKNLNRKTKSTLKRNLQRALANQEFRDITVLEPNDWIYDKESGKYIWDGCVLNPNETPEGFIYVGPSLRDVQNDFDNNNPISSFFTNPDMGENRTPWPGEIMAHESTVFEKVRDFGLEKGIPGSETVYNMADDVSVFVTGFYLLNPVGDQPLHLDGSFAVRGSQAHIDSGINGLLTVMPIPKFNIRGLNMIQSNKFFKGTWYNKLSPQIKGEALKTFNYFMKSELTPKKVFKQTKSNSEKVKN